VFVYVPVGILIVSDEYGSRQWPKPTKHVCLTDWTNATRRVNVVDSRENVVENIWILDSPMELAIGIILSTTFPG